MTNILAAVRFFALAPTSFFVRLSGYVLRFLWLQEGDNKLENESLEDLNYLVQRSFLKKDAGIYSRGSANITSKRNVLVQMVNLNVGLLFASVFVAGCSSQGKPKLTLELTSLELGDVIYGEIIRKDVIVFNEGSAPLLVEAVSTSCGCTKATLEPMTIQPGGKAVMHIELDSGAHGPELTGALIRQIFIASNDPEVPETVVEISARILPP